MFEQDTVAKHSSGKEKEEIGLKRGRSDSTTLAQRIPLGPGRAPLAPAVSNNAEARALPSRSRISIHSKRASTKIAVAEHITEEVAVKVEDPQSEMEVEDEVLEDYDGADLRANADEVQAMIGVEDVISDEDEVEVEKPPRMWPDISTELASRYQKEIQSTREGFDDDVDEFDTTMVSEYAEDIFNYMCDLEVRLLWFTRNFKLIY